MCFLCGKKLPDVNTYSHFFADGGCDLGLGVPAARRPAARARAAAAPAAANPAVPGAPAAAANPALPGAPAAALPAAPCDRPLAPVAAQARASNLCTLHLDDSIIAAVHVSKFSAVHYMTGLSIVRKRLSAASV